MGRDAEMHLFLRDGMEECDLGGVKHQARGDRGMAIGGGREERVKGRGVETVAEDGSVQTIRVSGMDAELVRATGKREEIDEKDAVRTVLTNDITGYGRLAMHKIHHLPRTIVRIRQKGKGESI